MLRLSVYTQVQSAITIALLVTAALPAAVCVTISSSQAEQPNSIKSPKITYNPQKVTRSQVVAAITAIFTSRGYKSTAVGRQTGVQFGIGGKATQFEEGSIKFITTGWQPPASGSRSKKWFYRAIIENTSVELQVFVERPPYNMLGLTIDSELTSWMPPDIKVVLQEIEKKLNAT